MTTFPRIAAIIPAHNEALTLRQTIETVAELPFHPRIIVVDDGSTDTTQEVAKASSVHLLSTGRQRGKGAALTLAVEQVPDVDLYLFLDADLEGSARHAAVLLQPLLDGHADLVIGILPPAHRKGGFGLVKWTAKKIVRHATGVAVHQPLSGQRALTAAAARQLAPFADGYAVEVVMTIEALRLGLRLCEIPTDFGHRETGRSPGAFLHRGKQLWDVVHASWERGYLQKHFPPQPRQEA
ncbi:MAG: glycosyltransferase family 2 protein [Firmicutes bacterium]|nr:glycosyltransferase family 2 protein [Bacillota bacterium]